MNLFTSVLEDYFKKTAWGVPTVAQQVKGSIVATVDLSLALELPYAADAAKKKKKKKKTKKIKNQKEKKTAWSCQVINPRLDYFSLKIHTGVPVVAQQLTSLTGIHEDAGLISSLTQWVKDLVLL